MIGLWRPTQFLLTMLFSILFLSLGVFPLGLLSQGVLLQVHSAQAQTAIDRTVNSVTVGGRVWRDSNGDGVQSADEPGIGAVAVVLFDIAGTLIDIGSTDSTGVYQFDGLEPGRYYAIPDQATLPVGLFPTIPNVGDSVTYDSVTDSDLLPGLGRTVPTFAIPAGGRFLSLDLGFYPLAAVGGRAWHDLNGDGIQGIGEPGLSDIEVHLLDGTGEPEIARTDRHGYYHFSALMAGHYQLLFIRPDDYRFSPPNQSAAHLDSDAALWRDDPSQAESLSFELWPGQNRSGFDVGLYGIIAIHGFAWADSNGDGIQGQDEPMLSGVDVKLYSYSSNVVSKLTTDETGLYAFTDLLPGDYYLQFTAPQGLICTRRLQDADDSSINYSGTISQMDPESAQIMLRGLEMDGDGDIWAAGFTKPSAIEDRVWLDNNVNGLLDGEEAGLADVLVELYDHEDQLQGSTRSDGQGFFQFMGLTPGNYRLQVHHPEGYYFTQFAAENAEIEQAQESTSGVNQMNGDVMISHVDPATGSSGMVALRPGLQSGFASAGLAHREPTQVLPTAVALMEFNAQQVTTPAGRTQILISWEMQSDGGDGAETQYYLYRSVYRDGSSHEIQERAMVARIISESSTETNGQWIDDSVLQGLHYRYWLVSVIEGQAGAEFGPIEVHSVQMVGLSRERQVFLPLIYGY